MSMSLVHSRRTKESPDEARQRFIQDLLVESHEKRQKSTQQLTLLMKQIETLLRKEQKVLPAYRRRFRGEDARSLFYYKMLRRIGLPEVHARFAPWFYKSDKLPLGRWSLVLFQSIEDTFFALPEQLSTLEERMREHQAEYEILQETMQSSSSNRVLPREWNQKMLRRAFRDVSFVIKPSRDDRRRESYANRELLDHVDDNEIAAAVDKLEIIPEIPTSMQAPPGLAPAIRGSLESRGKHEYVTYQGRWKTGDMHGSIGVYTFADSGTYRGEWKRSLPDGAGTATYPNGVKYTGDLVRGKYHGFGILERSDAPCFKYEGNFIDGQRCGHGKLFYLDSGSTYEGEFYDDEKHGHGTESSALGFRYTGQWRCNRICGRGTLYLPRQRPVLRTDWQPCLLGEAVRMVKEEQRSQEWAQESRLRSLLRVRDDLRVLDLMEADREAEADREEQEEGDRIEGLKRARKEKKEAQAEAKRKFLERTKEESEEVEEDDESEEGEADE